MFLCGSATLFAPPTVLPVLAFASKLAGFYLASINIGRFIHWQWPKHFNQLYDKLISNSDCPDLPENTSDKNRGTYQKNLYHAGIFDPDHTEDCYKNDTSEYKCDEIDRHGQGCGLEHLDTFTENSWLPSYGVTRS